jgi:replicative superfamily II helicase
MNNEIKDFTATQLRGFFTEVGLSPELTERAIKDYERYRASELDELFFLSATELRDINTLSDVINRKKIKNGEDLVEEIFQSYMQYIDYKSQIAETYQKTKDWATVFSTDVDTDSYEAQESFIDYIEQTYQTKIKDIKQLQELTGIYKVNSWDEKLNKHKPVGDEEAKENAIRELDETLTRARFNKFSRAVSKALNEGAKYKDLIQIQPKDYGLPESWRYCLASDQYTTILWAISLDYLLAEPSFIVLAPKPRDIAEDLEAPLSVIMDAIKHCNKWRA